MSAPRQKGISAQQILNVVMVAIAIFLLAVLAQRIATSIVLWRQTQVLQAEVDAQRTETGRLEKRKRYVQTDEYVEAVARRDMKMAKPGEVAVIATLAPAPHRAIGGSRWSATDLTHDRADAIIYFALRGGAVAARWAHNPKVGSSNLPPAT